MQAESVSFRFLTAEGDIIYRDTKGRLVRLGIGTSGQLLQSTGGVPAWVTDPSSGHITTAGTSGQVLITSSAGDAVWTDKIFVNSSGEFGIGTTSPEEHFYLFGGNSQFVDKSAGADHAIIMDAGTTGSTGSGSSQVGKSRHVFRDRGTDIWEISRSTSNEFDFVHAPSATTVATFTSSGMRDFLSSGSSGQIWETTGGVAKWVAPGAGGAGSTSGWRLESATTQAISSGLAETIMSWSVEVFDTDGFHSTASESSVVTITSTGVYMLGFQGQLVGTTQPQSYAVIKSGSTIIAAGGEIPKKSGVLGGFTLTTIEHFATSGSTITVGLYITTAAGTLSSGRHTAFWGWKLA